MVLDPNEGNESTINPLPEDNDTPASPPDDMEGTGPEGAETDLQTDTDRDHAYQEGEKNAAEKHSPSDSAVTGYDPEADQRNQA